MTICICPLACLGHEPGCPEHLPSLRATRDDLLADLEQVEDEIARDPNHILECLWRSGRPVPVGLPARVVWVRLYGDTIAEFAMLDGPQHRLILIGSDMVHLDDALEWATPKALGTMDDAMWTRELAKLPAYKQIAVLLAQVDPY